MSVLSDKVRAIGLRLEEHIGHISADENCRKLQPLDYVVMLFELSKIADDLDEIEGNVAKLRAHNVEIFPSKVGDGIKVRTVFRFVATEWHVPLQDLIGPLRTNALAVPRQIGCFISQSLIGKEVSTIAEFIDRDNATVESACSAALHTLGYDLGAFEKFQNVINKLGLQIPANLTFQNKGIAS